jgi:hypothetical protein
MDEFGGQGLFHFHPHPTFGTIGPSYEQRHTDTGNAGTFDVVHARHARQATVAKGLWSRRVEGRAQPRGRKLQARTEDFFAGVFQGQKADGFVGTTGHPLPESQAPC